MIEKEWATSQHQFPQSFNASNAMEKMIFEDIQNKNYEVEWFSRSYVILNAPSASFGDGWTIDDLYYRKKKFTCLFSLQMKFLRSIESEKIITFKNILKEQKKNEKGLLKLYNSMEENEKKMKEIFGEKKINMTVVTVIITDKRVSKDTKEKIEKSNNLIVICRNNFEKFFGKSFLSFALLKTCFLHINTLTLVELTRFNGITDELAKKIIENRPYKSNEVVNSKLKENSKLLSVLKKYDIYY